MKTHTKKHTLAMAIATLGMIGTSSATVIFNATPTNVTLGNNNIGGAGSITGSAGNLSFSNNTSNFNFTGFTSTQNINTLNGAAITAADTVTVRIAVSGLSGGQLRANGIDFGLNNAVATPLSVADTGDNVVRLEASNNGGDILSFFNGASGVDSGLTSTTGELSNGFTLELVANANGYTYTLDSVGATSPLTVSGTFSNAAEFVDTVGTSHFFYAQQQFNTGVALSANITEASIQVVPEPSSTALLGLGGLALIMRRRK